MKTHFLSLIICFSLFASSCMNKNTSDSINSFKDINIDSIPLIKICELSENIELISNISSFDFIDQQYFCIATKKPAKVIIYDKNGLQKINIGRIGRGPFEYISPTIVKVYNSKIYVWCASLIKLLVFDMEGKPIAEYTDIHHAIRNFVVHNNLVFFYSPSLTDKGIVEVFDLENKTSEKKYFGEITKEHEILGIREGSGSIILHNNNLLFTPTDKLKISIINLDNLSCTSFFIGDKYFPIQKINKSINEILSSPNNMIYIIGSNTVFGLFKTKKYIVLRAAIGELKMDKLKITDFSKRRQKYYFLNKETFDVEYTVSGKIYSNYNANLFSSDGNNIFTVVWSDKKERYYLYRVNLNTVINDDSGR